jgi:tetratricopeptide (TPR) repeat protein
VSFWIIGKISEVYSSYRHGFFCIIFGKRPFGCCIILAQKGWRYAMETRTKLEAWKIFLRGRIIQEKGDNDSALKAFDQALKLYPDNPFFLNAKSNALLTMNRSEEALVARVQGAYAELAKTYVGENDKPGPWIEGLEKLLAEGETLDRMAPVMVIW